MHFQSWQYRWFCMILGTPHHKLPSPADVFKLARAVSFVIDVDGGAIYYRWFAYQEQKLQFYVLSAFCSYTDGGHKGTQGNTE